MTPAGRWPAALAVSMALAALAGCGGPEPYGVVRDAGLSVDGKTLLVLVEHGTETTATSWNLWRGDLRTRRPESMRIHEVDRRSGQLGRVRSFPAERNPEAGEKARLMQFAGGDGPQASLENCGHRVSLCAIQTSPHPYRVSVEVIDPVAGKAVAWLDGRLVVAPFQLPGGAGQLRVEREGLLRRGVARMRAAAAADFETRATREDQGRIVTGATGDGRDDPGLKATYRLLPGRVTLAEFVEPGGEPMRVVWLEDGTCLTDSEAVVALGMGCRRTDGGELDRRVAIHR